MYTEEVNMKNILDYNVNELSYQKKAVYFTIMSFVFF